MLVGIKINMNCCDILDNTSLDILQILSVMDDVKMELYREHIIAVMEDRFDMKEKDEI